MNKGKRKRKKINKVLNVMEKIAKFNNIPIGNFLRNIDTPGSFKLISNTMLHYNLNVKRSCNFYAKKRLQLNIQNDPK